METGPSWGTGSYEYVEIELRVNGKNINRFGLVKDSSLIALSLSVPYQSRHYQLKIRLGYASCSALVFI